MVKFPKTTFKTDRVKITLATNVVPGWNEIDAVQLVGTDQVALAMENIKQASAQNVAGTRQTETAARNLHELGQKLKQLTLQYKM